MINKNLFTDTIMYVIIIEKLDENGYPLNERYVLNIQDIQIQGIYEWNNIHSNEYSCYTSYMYALQTIAEIKRDMSESFFKNKLIFPLLLTQWKIN
jgi:hypothetical protein